MSSRRVIRASGNPPPPLKANARLVVTIGDPSWTVGCATVRSAFLTGGHDGRELYLRPCHEGRATPDATMLHGEHKNDENVAGPCVLGCSRSSAPMSSMISPPCKQMKSC